MDAILEYMEKYDFENLFLCQDKAINFKAIIALHDTTLGPATGGCRMWQYDSEMDAIEDTHGVRIPVIAAGGVYDGDDIRRFLELGASGVQMGTRFVATHECDADLAFKQSYVDATKEDLMVIKSPVGLPGRALKNQFLADVDAGVRRPFRCPYHCIKTCDPENSPYCIGLALAAARRGKLSRGFAFAGSNAFRVDKIVSVEELMRSLEAGYESATA